MLSRKTQNKLFFITIILCIAVALCSFDHASLMAGTAEHAHAASPGCLSNLCVALTSQDDLLSVKISGLFLLLSFMLLSRLDDPLLGDGPSIHYRFARLNHLPKASHKLYQLHAAYLL